MTAPDSAEATAEPVAGARKDAVPAPSASAESESEPAGPVGVEATGPSEAAQLTEMESLLVTPAAAWADDDTPATALTWVDPATVADGSSAAEFDREAEPASGDSLLKGARLRPAVARPGILVPAAVLAGMAATYCGGALLWPLHEVAPTIEAVEIQAASAPAAAVTWPAQGSAAISVSGVSTVASSLDTATIASITKVVSTMMVLDRMPLAPGEQGPSFSFTRADSQEYWAYRRADQSALDVPVGGSLTELQMLQGTLLGSANNYIDRLAREIWGSDRAFAQAAEVWLRERGIEGITVVTPSGFNAGNVATPGALIELAQKAMQNPVFASIVSTPSVELPGAGVVTNTNAMLADAGVVGIKTGTLGESWNLLTAKDVAVGDTTVRLYSAVLGQSDDDQRLAATRSLFAQVEAALQAQEPVVPAGTVVGTVETMWGTTVDVVTDADAEVVLWNGAVAEATPVFELGEKREKGDGVGTLTAAGPLDSATVSLELADDVTGPDPWWRLTHPLELLGLTSEN